MALGFVLGHLWNHPSNRGQRLQTLCRAVGWQLRKRATRSPKVIDIYQGLKMRCYPNSRGAGVMIYSSCWHDYDEMHFVSRYLRPGDAVIDVGANIGIYSMLAASVVGRQGKVVSFEAGREAFQILSENVAINQLEQIIELHCEAIGSTEGKVRFLQNRGLVNRIVTDGESPQDESFDVMDCRTLDNVLQTPFALGKIDIEGTEPIAFEGGEQSLISGNPPVWIMEFKDRLLRKFNWTAEDFAKVVQDFGYRLAVFDANTNQLSLPERAWIEHENVIAVAESSLDDVRERLAGSDVQVQGAPDHRATVKT